MAEGGTVTRTSYPLYKSAERRYSRSMENNELITRLLSRAEALAQEAYGCDLTRLDDGEVTWYTAQVCARPWMMWELVDDLAAAAWQAY